jgi:hypothetical protein
MGLSVKINAMKNVVAEVPDMPAAGAVLQKIYQAFGVKGSFMVTWEGKGKLYWDPRTPVDKSVALAYAKQTSLPRRGMLIYRLMLSIITMNTSFRIFIARSYIIMFIR